ncbi:MAG TPA: hypothetical protein PLB01_04575 [Thermoanaerobaculia bacterium]|nr:hypothetical protein [Thermoanaerobaculia bacterium]
MPLADLPLEASRVLVALGLSVFVGIPLARIFGWLTRGEEEKEKEQKNFLEGEEGRERLGRARFVAAGALLLGVLLEVQVLGSSLPSRHVWRAVTIFVLLASLVYSVMVVAPKARYFDERSSTFEENLRAPWHARRDAARARGSKIDFLGFLLALAALVLG